MVAQKTLAQLIVTQAIHNTQKILAQKVVSRTILTIFAQLLL